MSYAERRRRYRERHAEKIRAYNRAWRERNREKCRAYYRQWAADNPDKVKAKAKGHHEALKLARGLDVTMAEAREIIRVMDLTKETKHERRNDQGALPSLRQDDRRPPIG